MGPLPPPLPVPRVASKGVPGWQWALLIGGGVVMVSLIVGGLALMKFTADMTHPERNPQAAGWLEPGEELVAVDAARRVLRVRRTGTSEVIEVRYEVGAKPPEWVPVPAGWTTKEGWLLRGPDFLRGSWTYSQSLDEASWKRISKGLRDQGYQHLVDNEVAFVKVLSARLEEPARTIGVSSFMGTTLFRASEWFEP